MNVSDTELVRSILNGVGGVEVPQVIMPLAGATDETSSSTATSVPQPKTVDGTPTNPDVILLNTCAIREAAEARVFGRLAALRGEAPNAILGVLGCMAERLKESLLQREADAAHPAADVVIGPDAYRNLPTAISLLRDQVDTDARDRGVLAVDLSLTETYEDITPARVTGVSAFLSIMRGCNNMCSFCVVPQTRGRERSRRLESIVAEAQRLVAEEGVREITLLGQNVNSYNDTSHLSPEEQAAAAEAVGRADASDLTPGFSNMFRRRVIGRTFDELLAAVSAAVPECRIRFTSPNPKDFPMKTIDVIANTWNIGKQIHLPAQSGSDTVLARMRRGHTRAAYDDLAARMRDAIPGLALSTDMIAGFCGETEEEHAASVDLLQRTQYDTAFLFAYSVREKTHAHRRLDDDVPADVKQRRLVELIDTHAVHATASNMREVGRDHIALVVGEAKRGEGKLRATTDTMKTVILDDPSLRPGDYVNVRVTGATRATLFGDVRHKFASLSEAKPRGPT